MPLSILIYKITDVSKQTLQDYENFKDQIQKIDGTVVNYPTDYSYIDVTIPEANYDLVKYVVSKHRYITD